MTIPIFCKKCGDIAGEVSAIDLEIAFRGGELDTVYSEECPGKGNHVERQERKCFFGLLKKVTLTYYHANTENGWYEYVGPASRFVLWLAICYAGSLFVNGKQVSWDVGVGFSGDGFKELFEKNAS